MNHLEPGAPAYEGEILERLRQLARARDPLPADVVNALYALAPPPAERAAADAGDGPD